jgi:hypothetical protein
LRAAKRQDAAHHLLTPENDSRRDEANAAQHAQPQAHDLPAQDRVARIARRTASCVSNLWNVSKCVWVIAIGAVSALSG